MPRHPQGEDALDRGLHEGAASWLGPQTAGMGAGQDPRGPCRTGHTK